MSKLTLVEKIKQKGMAEAASIREKGLKDAEAHYQKMLADAKAHFDNAYLKTQSKQLQVLETKKHSVERALRDENAMAKQKLIETVFNEVKAYLFNLKGKELFSYVKHAIEQESLEGNETIRVSKKDYETYQSILSTQKGDLVDCDLLNRALGSKFSLKLSKEPADLDSGFLVVGKTFDLNFSYEETIEVLMKSHEKKIYEEMA